MLQLVGYKLCCEKESQSQPLSAWLVAHSAAFSSTTSIRMPPTSAGPSTCLNASSLTKIPTTLPSSNILCRPPCSPYLSWSYAPKLPQDYSTDLAHSSSPSVSPAKTTVACASSLPPPIGPVSSPRNGPPSSPPAPFFLFFSRSRKSACPSSSLA